jgi:hypothetical protein
LEVQTKSMLDHSYTIFRVDLVAVRVGVFTNPMKRMAVVEVATRAAVEAVHV